MRLGLRQVPVSYAECYSRSVRLSRALFEPLVYLFFLACFVVMLQLLPTLRSYGERASIESEMESLFGRGRTGTGAITTRGYGPRGLGLLTPGLCPDVALWEDARALVDTELFVTETQRSWQWATQVSRCAGSLCGAPCRAHPRRRCALSCADTHTQT